MIASVIMLRSSGLYVAAPTSQTSPWYPRGCRAFDVHRLQSPTSQVHRRLCATYQLQNCAVQIDNPSLSLSCLTHRMGAYRKAVRIIGGQSVHSDNP